MNLVSGMPESVVTEVLESLNSRVLRITQQKSGRHDQDDAKNRPPTLTYLYQFRFALRCRTCVHIPKSETCECRWILTWLQEVHRNANMPALWTLAM